MQSVVAVGAEVVGCGVAGVGRRCRLAADDFARGDCDGLAWERYESEKCMGRRTTTLGELIALDRRIDAGIVVHEVELIEIQAARIELLLDIALVDAAVVEQVLESGGVVVGYIGDELETVGEGRDDEGVVVGERALEEVKANAACVEQDDAGNGLAARLVDND